MRKWPSSFGRFTPLDIGRCARFDFPSGNLVCSSEPNGADKTNLYPALQLLQASAAGALSRELAVEGGMESAAWGGSRGAKQTVRITLKATFAPASTSSQEEDAVYSYEVGLASPDEAAFSGESQARKELKPCAGDRPGVNGGLGSGRK